jgi:hypothetical protein
MWARLKLSTRGTDPAEMPPDSCALLAQATSDIRSVDFKRTGFPQKHATS